MVRNLAVQPLDPGDALFRQNPTEGRHFRYPRGQDAKVEFARRLLAALPAAYALIASTMAFQKARPSPLAPDAEGYLELAREFGLSTFGASIREPIWPTLLAGPVRLLGPHPSVLRAAGLVFFPALVVIFQALLNRLSGHRVAWIGALALAASPWLAEQSVRGLREVPAATGLLLFIYVLTRFRPTSTAHWASLGAGAGCLALLRWDTVLLTLPLLLFAALALFHATRRALAAPVVFAALVAPLLIGNAVEFGDPLRHSNIHAIFFRNIEFANHPGYPTTEQLAVDAYVGPNTSWSQYLFVENEVSTTFRRVPGGGVDTGLRVTGLGVFGAVEADPDPPRWPDLGILGDPKTFIPWLLLLCAGGSAIRLIGLGQPLLPVAAAIAMWQHSPVAHLIDLRLGLTVWPLLLLLAFTGIPAAIERLRAGIAVHA